MRVRIPLAAKVLLRQAADKTIQCIQLNDAGGGLEFHVSRSTDMGGSKAFDLPQHDGMSTLADPRIMLHQR